MLVGGLLVVTGPLTGVIAMFTAGVAVFAFDVAGGIGPAGWLTAFGGLAIVSGWIVLVGLATWYFWWWPSSPTRNATIGVVQLLFCAATFATGSGLTYLVLRGS